MITCEELYNPHIASDTSNPYSSNERPFILQDDIFSGKILYINQDYYQNHFLHVVYNLLKHKNQD